MNEITFAGEHLLPGNIGKLAIYISLAASLFSFISYSFGVNNKAENDFWKRMGRVGFILHGIAVCTIFYTLFYIIQNHYFEYQYAWQHSSTELPLKYMISCFWEGQEGSFLLWMTWHVVLGTILLFRAKSWEAPVMAVIALAQVMLSTMLLGVEVFDVKIGSNPFVLLRDHQPDLFSIPMMAVVGAENYLKLIQDGNGLNPLLQNYWMVIHPPTLFLGFAASIVPFAFAIAGLWTGRIQEWVRPALPWTLFGVMILGTGIIMGGFWAYESLNFGGYWAWDPVENASLIPWLLLIASAHTMVINKSTGKALYITFILAIFSFVLVLYATFLTRSGILGETSVHAFTDLGMSGQLLLFLFVFILLPSYFALRSKAQFAGLVALSLVSIAFNYLKSQPGFVENFSFLADNTKLFSIIVGSLILLVVFISIYRTVPKVSQADDELSSREFWMFIGALTFVISCFQVAINTSMPVWNKLFGLDKAPPVDVITYYNQWQLPIAIIVGLLLGFGQFLKYKKTEPDKYKNLLLIVLIASMIVTIPVIFLFNLRNALLIILLFSGVFAIVGNLVYLFKVLKGRIRFSGGSIAHVGFGLMILGIVASGSGKKVITANQTNTDLSDIFENVKDQKENLLLWKGTPVIMENYEVTFAGDTVIPPNTYFKIDYKGIDPKTGNYTGEYFQLRPNAQNNPKMGLVSNPDTRHYLTYDIFTYITQYSDKESYLKAPFSNFKVHNNIRVGDTLFTNNGIAILTSLSTKADKKELGLEDADHVLMAELKVITLTETFYAHPIFAVRGDMFSSVEDDLHEAGLRFKLTEIKTEEGNFNNTTFVFETAEKAPAKEFVILKALLFPYINFLWGGTIIMVFGFLLSIFQRAREKTPKKEAVNEYLFKDNLV